MVVIPPPRVARRLAAAAVSLAVLTGASSAAVAAPALAGAPDDLGERRPAALDLGPNVTVFDPTMPTAEIQAAIDAVAARQVDDEMGNGRHALLFLPGEYGSTAEPLQIRVGYYTEVAGLGASPGDVTITGKIEVYNRCQGPDGVSDCVALVNFWRTWSNLTLDIDATGQDGCRSSANFWAVSQAVSMRRVDVTGGTLSLMDYCTAGPQFASGGFIADSRLGDVINGSQQQWLTRNSEIGSWSNGVWNQVFSGVEGAPSGETFPDPPYTTLDTTPVSREKPYLVADGSGRHHVRVPEARRDTRGITWDDGPTPGRSIPLHRFFVASPADSVQRINRELARGRHLLLTPGMYDVAESIRVRRPGTVVLGLGHATLTAVDGAVPLTVADVPGAVVAGVTIDAGTVESPALLQVGPSDGDRGRGDGRQWGTRLDPTTLSDIYLRVGGPYVGRTDVGMEINSDDVLIDHTWVWRADHGVEGFSGDTERWFTSTGRNGVVVNGDRVTATGLFVEHFQEHNTIWNGEDGTVVLYQNELPYDPPSQAEWRNGDVLGWAGYKVADDVERHTLFGGGVYVFNRNDPSIRTENGFEVPVAPGVRLNRIMTVNLTAGTIDHVVNGIGEAADTTRVGVPVYVTHYP